MVGQNGGMVEGNKWRVAQNVVGAVAGALLIGLGGAVFGMWLATSQHSLRLDQHDAKFDELYKFKNDGKRYTLRMGNQEREDRIAANRRQTKICNETRMLVDKMHRDVESHNRKAEGYISTIERNTPIILSNQAKAHTHLSVPSGR